jgi:hypothetical protein
MRILSFLLVLLTTSLNAQQWNWAVDAGGGGNTDLCYDIATDSQGNAYWVGSASGTANFGCATLTPGSTIAGVLAKYDASGACQWVVGITTSFYDAWVYGIATTRRTASTSPAAARAPRTSGTASAFPVPGARTTGSPHATM